MARLDLPLPRGRNIGAKIVDFCVVCAPLVVMSLLMWLLGDLLWRGMGAFLSGGSNSSWLQTSLDFLVKVIGFLTGTPERAGRSGGIGSILISTALILLICMTVAVPIGLGTALFLSESGIANERFSRRVIRRSLETLAGVPSIVFGLFGNAVYCRLLGFGFSIVSGGLTLACMVLPLLIRAAEESLRAVPSEQRQAAAALGLSKWTTIGRIVLPQAIPGIVAGLILGIGRALAETAALIFTSGYVDRMPSSVFDSGRSLAIHIYDLSMNVAGGNQNAYASALVLIGFLLIINCIAGRLTVRLVGGTENRVRS